MIFNDWELPFDIGLVSVALLLSAHQCYACVGLGSNEECNMQETCPCPYSQQV